MYSNTKCLNGEVIFYVKNIYIFPLRWLVIKKLCNSCEVKIQLTNLLFDNCKNSQWKGLVKINEIFIFFFWQKSFLWLFFPCMSIFFVEVCVFFTFLFCLLWKLFSVDKEIIQNNSKTELDKKVLPAILAICQR